MLTKKDQVTQVNTGLIPPDRLRAAQHALMQRARDAHAASTAATDQRAAAALRGKSRGYREGADMLESLLAGNPLGLPSRVKRENRSKRAQMRLRKQLDPTYASGSSAES